ncbi:MAG: NAD(P)-binding protein [Steroidobacteraceae bacterium]
MISASIAVIGAGLARLACARRLAEVGLHPQVFDAQRSPGGRLATRRFESAGFDHGAQYLTVSDARFRRVIEAAHLAGAAARRSPRWQADDRGRGELWVGAPDAAMSTDPILPQFARNGSKPGRETPQSWVLHASAEWTRAAFDQPAARVQAALFERFSELLGRTLAQPRLADSHRWRHARVERRSANRSCSTSMRASVSSATGASTRAPMLHSFPATRWAGRAPEPGAP